jgi:hypothetical protein
MGTCRVGKRERWPSQSARPVLAAIQRTIAPQVTIHRRRTHGGRAARQPRVDVFNTKSVIEQAGNLSARAAPAGRRR